MVDAVASKLVMIGGVLTGEVFPLNSDEVTLGRDAENTIGIPDGAISRRHCAFSRDPAGWRVRDLGSSNGTFVNDVQVQNHLLADGDRVAAGESVLLFVHGSPAPASMVILDDQERSDETTCFMPDLATYLRPRQQSSGERRRTEEGLRVLLGISTVVNSIRDEARLCRELVDLLFEAVPAEEGAILRPVAGDELVVEAVRPVRAQGSVQVSAAMVRRAVREGVGVLSTETGGGDRQRSMSSVAASNPRSLIAVPISVDDTALAAIYLATAPGAAFTEGDLELVTAVGRISAMAFNNVRQMTALERETDRLQASLHLSHQMVGESAPVREVYSTIAKVARVDTTVLITGETGTGKELAARAIHFNSSRARRPFVAINCAALAENLLESELFGHERGAFTGALAQKKGKLELGDGGTVFLDEVGELAPALQSKLLRVLQERELERVGGTRPIKIDVRILSATNRDLPAGVAAGTFRSDLYFRLAVVSIRLPALRDRRDDVSVLARHFLSVYARKCGRRVTRISPAAMQRLIAYDWPGNVRELENAIERAIVMGSTDEVLPEDLPDSLLETAPSPDPQEGATEDLQALVVDAKRRAVLAAFHKAGRNYTQAAKLLGVHPNYLHRLIRNLDMKTELEKTAV
jgi:transcriptional regulator with GAF, ATPase, and Fis domain